MNTSARYNSVSATRKDGTIPHPFESLVSALQAQGSQTRHLYVLEEFDIAMHLCACGCGFKVEAPLGPTDWCFTETKSGPSRLPSVQNRQQPCQSHCWTDRGQMCRQMEAGTDRSRQAE